MNPNIKANVMVAELKGKSLSLVWASVTIFILAATIHARETPFFWEEFDDADASKLTDNMDGDVSSFENGSLIITPLADDFPGAFTSTPDLTDVTVLAQLRFLGEFEPEINPFVGIWARDPIEGDGGDSGGYWGGVSANGILYIGVTPVGGGTDIRKQVSVFTPDEVRENDIHYQFDTIGDEISIRAWLNGSEKPSRPQLTMFDEAYAASQVIGMFENPSDSLSGFAMRSFAVLPAVRGDFNANNMLDSEDIDLLSAEILAGGMNRALDLDGDARVTSSDRAVLIGDLLGTTLGDSNLDGVFNSLDLVSVLQFGQYDDGTPFNSTWSTGDWDGNFDFDREDIVAALQAGGYVSGPRLALTAVPEPTCLFLTIQVALFAWLICSRRHRNTLCH